MPGFCINEGICYVPGNNQTDVFNQTKWNKQPGKIYVSFVVHCISITLRHKCKSFNIFIAKYLHSLLILEAKIALNFILRDSLDRHRERYIICIFSLPEQKVLRLSYCDQLLSIVVFRPSSVVNRP